MNPSSSRSWSFDHENVIGSGGFAKVVGALSSDGLTAAAKFVPKAESASRDLLALDLPNSPYLVPISEVVEADDHWVIIMPRAENSLRDRLNSVIPIGQNEALAILTDIAQGLAAIEGKLVHRDLKPENVLRLDGHWAICDFGISRYAEASTAADTRKYSMTAPYAAPEQWRQEHSTGAADVYAFGILAYEVLTGSRPFNGPDFRDQHLHQEPPYVQVSRRLRSLLIDCLDKAPAARPSPQNLIIRLERAEREPERPGALSLANANELALQQRAAASRDAEISRTEAERRAELFRSASTKYDRIVEELLELIVDVAPSAEVHKDDGDMSVRLGFGVLNVSRSRPFRRNEGLFDVIGFGELGVYQTGNNPVSRSHSLYFADFDAIGTYDWYELAFINIFGSNDMFGNHDITDLPSSREPYLGLDAFRGAFGGLQLGRPIVRLNSGEMDETLDRWVEYFGDAAQGKLSSPSTLPEGFPKIPRR